MNQQNKLTRTIINESNLKDFAKAEAIAYTSEPTKYYIERLEKLADPKRAIALSNGDKIIGTANSFSEVISLPGNKSANVSAVSYVSVQPTHRRQGILSEMMNIQLNEFYSKYKEPLAILWPSETAIYGRFGYAPTHEKHYEIAKKNVQFIPSVVNKNFEAKFLDKKEAIKLFTDLNNALMKSRPGVMKLTQKWAERRINDLIVHHLGTGPSYFVGIYNHDNPVGFVTYTIENSSEDGGNMPASLHIWDIMYLNIDAAIKLWDFCLNIDLVEIIYAKGVPADDILESIIMSPGNLNSRITTGLWIRIVNVIEALKSRKYNKKGKMIFKLKDSIINENNNTFLLDTESENATICTTSNESPDIEITINGLSEMYLGTFNLNNLIASKNIKIINTNIINYINDAFRENITPFCPMHF